MPSLRRRQSALSLKTAKTRSLTLLRRATTLRLRRKKTTHTEEIPPPSPLLLLPPELRNQIYVYCLQLSTRENRIEMRNLKIPPLLAASRQLLQEANSIYFAENFFVLTLRFRHRYRLEDMVVPPLQAIMRIQGVRMGPVLDMRLDAWMPWVYMYRGRGMDGEMHRIHLANLESPIAPRCTSWVHCTQWVPGDVAEILRNWRPDGEPCLQEVLNKVVEPVWWYHKVLSSPVELDWPPRASLLTRLRERIMMSMDDQDRSWSRW